MYTRPSRALRAAITRQATDLAPLVTSELERQALDAITAWCVRPRRNTVPLAVYALAMTSQSASLNRMLDAAIRACVLTHHDSTR